MSSMSLEIEKLVLASIQIEEIFQSENFHISYCLQHIELRFMLDMADLTTHLWRM